MWFWYGYDENIKTNEPVGTIAIKTKQIWPSSGSLLHQNQNKHKDLTHETKISDGRKGAPRIVAVVPLCEDGDAQAAVRQFKEVEDDIPDIGTITTRYVCPMCNRRKRLD